MQPIVIENSKRYDEIEDGERFLLEQFKRSSALANWKIYEQPHLNGDRPDFVLCHPEKGVIIIEVKDYNLASTNYRAPGKVLGNDGQWKNIDPVKQIKKYKDNLLQFISRNYLQMRETFQDNAYAMVETVLYFHNADEHEARDFCELDLSDHIKVITRKQALAIGNDEHGRAGIQTLKYPRSKFAKSGLLQQFVKDLEAWLEPSDYHIDRLEPIDLFPDQKRYSKINSGSMRRLSGVAGSGKSLILATKAATMLKKGYRVLVLTYNITLRHLLRDMISQQFGVGNRKLIQEELVINHFHSFLVDVAAKHEIKLPRINDEKEDRNFAENLIEKISKEISQFHQDYKFDAILIDEGQDFKPNWVKFLKLFFTKRGEFFIFYDIEQDLYGRQEYVWIEDSEQIAGLGFKGPAGTLKVARRLPGRAVHAITALKRYLDHSYTSEMLVPHGQLDFFTDIKWENCCSSSNKPEVVFERLKELISKGAKIDDICILSTHEKTGAAIVNYLEAKGYKTVHVYDLDAKGNIEKRRSEKWKFQPGNSRLKVCSVHSFKGWEASHIIFVMDEPYRSKKSTLGLPSRSNLEESARIESDRLHDEHFKMEDLLYIALTRLRYHNEVSFCSFTGLNYIPEYNDLEKVFANL
jgi:hypothetical protein